MVGGCSLRKTVVTAGWDVERIQHAQVVHQIRARLIQRQARPIRQILKRSAKTMAPHLLPLLQMQGLEGLLDNLMRRGKGGPFMVVRSGAQFSQAPVRFSLMKPVS